MRGRLAEQAATESAFPVTHSLHDPLYTSQGVLCPHTHTIFFTLFSNQHNRKRAEAADCSARPSGSAEKAVWLQPISSHLTSTTGKSGGGGRMAPVKACRKFSHFIKKLDTFERNHTDGLRFIPSHTRDHRRHPPTGRRRQPQAEPQPQTSSSDRRDQPSLRIVSWNKLRSFPSKAPFSRLTGGGVNYRLTNRSNHSSSLPGSAAGSELGFVRYTQAEKEPAGLKRANHSAPIS